MNTPSVKRPTLKPAKAHLVCAGDLMIENETKQAMQLLISSLFEAIEYTALRGQAYSRVVKMSVPFLESEIEMIVRDSISRRQYTGLRQRVIQAVRDDDFVALSGLIGEVERIVRS